MSASSVLALSNAQRWPPRFGLSFFLQFNIVGHLICVCRTSELAVADAAHPGCGSETCGSSAVGLPSAWPGVHDFGNLDALGRLALKGAGARVDVERRLHPLHVDLWHDCSAVPSAAHACFQPLAT